MGNRCSKVFCRGPQTHTSRIGRDWSTRPSGREPAPLPLRRARPHTTPTMHLVHVDRRRIQTFLDVSVQQPQSPSVTKRHQASPSVTVTSRSASHAERRVSGGSRRQRSYPPARPPLLTSPTPAALPPHHSPAHSNVTKCAS